jgi:hypothetical protein
MDRARESSDSVEFFMALPVTLGAKSREWASRKDRNEAILPVGSGPAGYARENMREKVVIQLAKFLTPQPNPPFEMSYMTCAAFGSGRIMREQRFASRGNRGEVMRAPRPWRAG